MKRIIDDNTDRTVAFSDVKHRAYELVYDKAVVYLSGSGNGNIRILLQGDDGVWGFGNYLAVNEVTKRGRASSYQASVYWGAIQKAMQAGREVYIFDTDREAVTWWLRQL